MLQLQAILFMSQRCSDYGFLASSNFVWFCLNWAHYPFVNIRHFPRWTARIKAMDLSHPSDPFRPFSWLCGEDSNLGGLQELQMWLSKYPKPVENEVKWKVCLCDRKILAQPSISWILCLLCFVTPRRSRMVDHLSVALRNNAVVVSVEKNTWYQ